MLGTSIVATTECDDDFVVVKDRDTRDSSCSNSIETGGAKP